MDVMEVMPRPAAALPALLALVTAFAGILLLAPAPALAQSKSILDRVTERATQRAETTTENKANQEVDATVDKTVDCMFNPVECAKKAQTPPAPGAGGTPPGGAAPTAADTSEWYAESQGKRVGPMPKTQLATMATSGELTTATLVWKEGMSGWTKAGEVPELGDVFAKVPPPLPPKSGPPPLPSR